jgi:hypothetical protein
MPGGPPARPGHGIVSLLVGDDFLQDIGHRSHRHCGQLFLGAVLNRMCQPDDGGFKTKRFRLRFGGWNEAFRNHCAARDGTTVEGQNVMQTARRTRSSVGQPFDHNVARVDDRLDDRFGRGLGVCRFDKALDRDALL